MTRTVRLRGVVEPRVPVELEGTSGIEVTPRERVRVGLARDVAGMVEVKGLAPDDVACVEYSNGFRLWTRVDDLHHEQPANQLRGAGTPDAEVWEIEPRLGLQAAQREMAGIAIEALQFFQVDLKAIAAEKLCAWFEKRTCEGGKPGLYRCALEGACTLEPVSGEVAPARGPTLVLLHGTASSTRGSFGSLWDDSNPEGRNLVAAWRATYGDRVFGFDHATFTESPFDNAISLIERFPKGASLDLLTHSRGGLIGELLCLGERQGDKDALGDDRLDLLFQRDRTPGDMLGLGPRDATDAYAAERGKLDALLRLLKTREVKVRRLVRVACPARGTTLASGRLDRWLSVLHFLGVATGVEDAVDFLLGVVKRRTDPRSLPGLEAMMPGSALIRLLNQPDLQVAADLTVIAGDLVGDSFWGRLKGLLSDWFYAGDHDLVVNTGSMYGGARRPSGGARFLLDRGVEVTHFGYFTNGRTVRAIADGLKSIDGARAVFEPIEAAAAEEPAWRSAVQRSASQGPRPVAVVIPGTMGSQLEVRGNRVWLNYWDLARGRLADLAIDATRVRPLDLLGDFYGEFLIFLAQSHEVVPFPYDWRVSVIESARELADRLENDILPRCEKAGQPVRLLAHSLGGLVVRAMIAGHAKVWQRLRNLPGSRVVMFGTPNRGSLEAMRWLTGWNPTLGKLSLLDITHGRDELLAIVGRFPGLLELLPGPTDTRDFSRPAYWEDLRAQVKGSWPLPHAGTLQSIRQTWDLLEKSPIDKERMRYVAGCAPATVADFEVVEERIIGGVLGPRRPTLRFYGHRRGDGTVTWDSGILPGVQTWYAEDTVHDQLLSEERLFPAYLELIQTGETSRLPQAAPASRGAEGDTERFIMPPAFPESVPGEQERGAFTLGVGGTRPRARVRKFPRVELSIRNGNLAYARHPVCVGHYHGDTIVSAEAALDRCLQGALSRRARLGLYPGLLGTHEVFINGELQGKPDGVVVVGLGQVGELSPGSLTSGVQGAVLDYALTVADWPDDRFGPKGSLRSARLSCLLVGTGFGSLTTRDSIESILRGIAMANQRLQEGGFADQVLVDGVEFIELFQDIAIEAAIALPQVLEESDLKDHFEWKSGQVEAGQGGRRRVLFREGANWWERLEIVRDSRQNDLRFIALTDRARAEESLVSGQLRLADDFIRVACAQTANNRDVARTLFEMLVPNRLKEMAPRQEDMVLLLDETSAAYPWELLEDRWAVNGRPLSVAAGMLRQLKTAVFRPHPVHATRKTAYVVGNPDLGSTDGVFALADLPGAEREATEVEGLLREAGYTVTSRIHASARDILVELHRDDYRILHLAGHGVHEFEWEDGGTDADACPACNLPKPPIRRTVSGMVLGNGIFLTPGDIEQMRTVPEIVFINCCHLGTTQSTHPAFQRYTALAANLGSQFIRMGVKAVVAAGWAVDDAAAMGFARAFYRRLFAGDGFGDAVRGARSEIYDRHPQSNTWGAYQCYGDPDFRVVETGRRRQRRRPPYRAAPELIADLENLASDFRVNAARNTNLKPAAIEELLELIPPTIRPQWLARADVNAAFGTAYAELGEIDQALEYFDAAIEASRRSPAQTTTLRVVEWRANLRVKRALEKWLARPGASRRGRARTTGTAAEALSEVDEVIQHLGTLNTTLGPSVERCCLLGSAHKRRAWMTTGKAGFNSHLRSMADAYARALRLADDAVLNSPCIDSAGKSYPLTNWIAAQAVLQWTGVSADRELPSRLQECQSYLDRVAKVCRDDPSFWMDATEPNLRLAIAMTENRFDGISRHAVAEAFGRTLRRGASRKDQRAIAEHIDFLITMADRTRQEETARELRALRSELG